MPDKKFSDLPAAGALGAADVLPIMQVGATVKTTVGALDTRYLVAGGGGGGEQAVTDHVAAFDPHGAVSQPAAVAVGQYYGPGGAATTAARPDGFMTLVPLFVDRTLAFDRIAADITTAGNAGSLLRLGFYTDVAGKPTALSLDAGTIAADVTGVRAITINKQLTPGRWWLACCIQSAATTLPTLRVLSARGDYRIPFLATNFSQGVGWGTGSGGQGALPATVGSGVAVAIPADVGIIVAARAA